MNKKERETCEFEMDFQKSFFVFVFVFFFFWGGGGGSDQSNVDIIS